MPLQVASGDFRFFGLCSIYRLRSVFDGFKRDLEASIRRSGEAFKDLNCGASFAALQAIDGRNRGLHPVSKLLLGEPGGFAGFNHGDGHFAVRLCVFSGLDRRFVFEPFFRQFIGF